MYFGYIDATCCQTLERNLAQRIVPDARNEPDASSQRCQIVRDNRRRTAQREHHTMRQQFPLARKLVRQTVQNKIKVQFTGNGDIKAWHA